MIVSVSVCGVGRGVGPKAGFPDLPAPHALQGREGNCLGGLRLRQATGPAPTEAQNIKTSTTTVKTPSANMIATGFQPNSGLASLPCSSFVIA